MAFGDDDMGITQINDKKCVNKKERERQLPGYCQQTLLESADCDESG